MKLFISYHRADTKSVTKIKTKLEKMNINFYSVPEDSNFTNWHNEEISKFLLKRMKDCHILLCVVGKETYQRPHVDYEIHEALKGGARKRLGIIAVILDDRGDSIYNLDKSTFPARLLDNKKYVVILQNATLIRQIEDAIKFSDRNRKNSNIQVDNTRNCMRIPNKYYDE